MNAEKSTIHVAEYQAAQDCYLHYDSFRWQSASFLFAGVAAFWAIIASNSDQNVSSAILWGANLLIAALMSAWLLYAHHYRQIYLCKLHRIHQLERIMFMEQHRRFSNDYSDQPYQTFGPKGHHLDYFVYVIASLGGAILTISLRGRSEAVWFVLMLAFVAFVLGWVLVNERKIRDMLLAYDGPQEST
jgi:hypothetical protein